MQTQVYIAKVAAIITNIRLLASFYVE